MSIDTAHGWEEVDGAHLVQVRHGERASTTVGSSECLNPAPVPGAAANLGVVLVIARDVGQPVVGPGAVLLVDEIDD